MVLLPVEQFGWKLEKEKIKVEWDSQENLQRVKECVAFLIHGCGCKTGCKTHHCKAGNPRGPGCKCNSCQNKDTSKGIVYFPCMLTLHLIPFSIENGRDDSGAETSRNGKDSAGFTVTWFTV